MRKSKLIKFDESLVQIARVIDCLHYNIDDGKFIWIKKSHPSVNVQIGSEAGAIVTSGYRQIRLDNIAHMAHRLAWFYQTGCWPKSQIDHINNDRLDNRFSNLREATCSQNSCNSQRHVGNKTGYRGVRIARSVAGAAGREFCAQIRYQNKHMHL